ncbi:peroxiredoxin-like family protein [Aquimarina sp. RZ0]|uniref:peroxiredoxin-like family protein n=1 Tax=Aquimarina sp. RZ0 TaxID=2607730 RepID=UPI0011F2BC19|nr:peroxiredoxin-like family protein [Aquimarina sp. RZ0]KAA1247936.1 AhpC/TSA family protein [Aquimarina sp. RZ0]
MSLSETLLKANQENRTKIPNEILDIMDSATKDLISKGISGIAIKEGEVFPDFSLPNSRKNEIALKDLLTSGSVVISFYRGGWCPYCNIELKALQNALPEFKERKATLIAITPETPDNSLTTAEKNSLTFEVLSDIDNTLAKKIGLVFKLPEALQEIYNKFGLDVAKHNQNDNFELPVAATFVVNSTGVVSYRFVNEDYTKRADIEDILKALNE